MTDTTYPIIIRTARMFIWYPGMYVTSTTGGNHVSGSYHYKGEAVDFGSGDGVHAKEDAWLTSQGLTRWQAMDEMAAWWYRNYQYLSELEHTKRTGTSGWFVKNQKKVSYLRYGLDYLNHRTHNHVAVATLDLAHKLLYTQVQKNLRYKGYGVSVDGDLGPQSITALKEFQRSKGLVADGIPGDLTTAALR